MNKKLLFIIILIFGIIACSEKFNYGGLNDDKKIIKAIENNDIKSILPTTLDGLSIYDNWWYKYYFLWCYYQKHENKYCSC